MIECRKHGLSESYRHRNGHRCKKCCMENISKWRRKTKNTLVLEWGGACKICGYNKCVRNLHFHHVDPKTKCFGISQDNIKSLARAREEAKKCVLLCANCHGEVEEGLVVL